jgi:hypothetical protein
MTLTDFTCNSTKKHMCYVAFINVTRKVGISKVYISVVAVALEVETGDK